MEYVLAVTEECEDFYTGVVHYRTRALGLAGDPVGHHLLLWGTLRAALKSMLLRAPEDRAVQLSADRVTEGVAYSIPARPGQVDLDDFLSNVFDLPGWVETPCHGTFDFGMAIGEE